MKRGRTLNPYGVLPEMLQEGGMVLVKELAILHNKCQKQGYISKSLLEAEVTLKYKKKYISDLDNYKPIRLLSDIIYKL